MKLAVLQLMHRHDDDAERVALAEATARAVARGADLVVPPARIVLGVAADMHALDVLGKVAVLTGDEAIDPAEHARLAADPPDALVLYAGAESDLQAEAVVELAIALSLSVCGTVVVSERSGAEPGEPGHGGSAIIVLGQVVAEAMTDDDVIIADVPVPPLSPDPRNRLPELPPILGQRLAHHRGERMPVEYPADLT